MDRFRLAAPILRLVEPERAHALTLWALRHGWAPPHQRAGGGADDPVLECEVWGRRFANPLGLAAGFDKDAAVVGPMLGLGFGFVEVGTITPEPQPGNPRPRVFRLPAEQAVINRIGFASQGMAAAAERLARWRAGGAPGLVGVNLGRGRESAQAAADYAAGAKVLGPLADYLVINVSSPNTPGLRALQGRAALEALVGRVRAALSEALAGPGPGAAPPLLVKIAPDLSAADQADIAEAALGPGIDGLIVSNTTVQRPPGLRGRQRAQAGGLSGRPLFALSTEVLADMYRLTGGRVPLVGVGGIASPADAYAKVRAGASLVQLYTALVYQGPGLVPRLKAGLAALVRRDRFAGIAQAVGADHR